MSSDHIRWGGLAAMVGSELGISTPAIIRTEATCGIRYAIISKPATSAITPLLACSRLALLVVGCVYFLLSVALCQRLFRPRAKAAYSSRSRCCRSRSTVCLGDIRYDKNRIRSDSPLAECTIL